MQEQCRNNAGIMQVLCRNTEGTMQELCRNTVGTMYELYRNTAEKKFRDTEQEQCRNNLPEEGRGEWGKRLSDGLQIALPDETSGPPYTLQVQLLHSCKAAFYIYLILLVGRKKILLHISILF